MVANRAQSFQEAEEWDLDFWQSVTPEERLSVMMAIQRDMARGRAERKATEDPDE